MTFPRDDFTPFGFLANPFHRARSWREPEAGVLRSTQDYVGFGWLEPTARSPRRELSLIVMVRWNGRLYRTRTDFAGLGYRSHHHTSALFSYDWRMDGVAVSVQFALADRDALVGAVSVVNQGPLVSSIEFYVVGVVEVANGRPIATEQPNSWQFNDEISGTRAGLSVQAHECRLVHEVGLINLEENDRDESRCQRALQANFQLAPGETWQAQTALTRDVAAVDAGKFSVTALRVCAERLKSDNAFYREVARPTGEWPDSWKRGWIYDLETTRACIYPRGGIFQHEWLSWMMSWPRSVIAEATLDAARFSYADPVRALSLVETLFTDSPAANVPCVFQGGEPNMVAKDGTICGTSPAWCLPFHNLWLLYCRTLDQAWLRRIYPRLEAYLRYWLKHRVDEGGWVVYKCTWEAGEDATPRLDPQAQGDEVISHVVRPVELQAAMSYSAQILARFARVVGEPQKSEDWSTVAADYAGKTHELWDPVTGRFRDWDKRTTSFLEGTGGPDYWQTDPVRFSALSLIPLVAGQADPQQRVRLEAEIALYDTVPWCIWPSWSFVVAEAASAAGWYDFAGRFAHRIVERVYQGNDRRSTAEVPRPTPGTSPEYWPMDLGAYDGTDGYGWGANTSSLWIRQIFGLLECGDGDAFAFALAPSLPDELLGVGCHYGFRDVPFRGRRLAIDYIVTPSGLVVTIAGINATSLEISAEAESNRRIPVDQSTLSFRFVIKNRQRVVVTAIT